MDEEWVMKHTYNGRYLPIQELVRCRDCKYALDDEQNTTRYWCSYKWPATMVPDTGFCFRGERKD